MKHTGFIALSSAAFLFLGAAGALAASSETTADDGYIWREAQPVYEFKHPMKVTCEEFLDTDQIYRPYVVAWLSGRSVGVTDIADPDEFVPVSVPQTVQLCKEEPDMLVWELVKIQ